MRSDPVMIIGAGVMGTGIAATAVGHGVPVLLVDRDASAAARAEAAVRGQLRHAQLLDVLPADRSPGPLTVRREVEAGEPVVAVVEAVVEDVAAKQATLAAVAAVVKPGTPMLTNTSGIPVDRLATALDRPGDLVGVHFMNPAYLIETVEMVRGSRTGEETTRRCAELLSRLGRRAITVRDSPGFVTSRLLHPQLNDAARLVGEGVATPSAVDELMRACLGHRVGPLRTADLIGLDNLVDSLASLHALTGDSRYQPCETLLAKVEAGDLGRKSGRGFYEYGGRES